MKFFPNTGGAYKYAENASKKYEDDRYVVMCTAGFYVQKHDAIDEGESIIAHYKNGERIK